MKDIPSEMISVLNCVLQSATTGDGRRKAALSTELVQIPQGTSFWNSLYSILPLLRSFFSVWDENWEKIILLKNTNVKKASFS